ncbi:hypothetical protein [Streptosporangium subroseum]|nr:hypothetical protein [Streptosporangium subroseum]
MTSLDSTSQDCKLLRVPLLTDDAKFAGSTGHRAEIHRYPPPLM